MPKFLLVLFALVGALPAFAADAPVSPEDLARAQRVARLQYAVGQACHLPPITRFYSRYAIDRFIYQVEDPELAMLNTAFTVGFETMESDLLPYAYCVVVFMGRPNDPTWEPNFDFYGKAQAAGKLPAVMFGGFDANGEVILKPVEKKN